MEWSKVQLEPLLISVLLGVVASLLGALYYKMDTDLTATETRLTARIDAAEARLETSLKEVKAELTKSIDEVKVDLKAHQTQYAERDREVAETLGSLMTAVTRQIPLRDET